MNPLQDILDSLILYPIELPLSIEKLKILNKEMSRIDAFLISVQSDNSVLAGALRLPPNLWDKPRYLFDSAINILDYLPFTLLRSNGNDLIYIQSLRVNPRGEFLPHSGVFNFHTPEVTYIPNCGQTLELLKKHPLQGNLDLLPDARVKRLIGLDSNDLTDFPIYRDMVSGSSKNTPIYDPLIY